MTKRKERKKSLKKRFSEFSELIGEIGMQDKKLSKAFIQEIEQAVHCLGIILFDNDPEFNKIRAAQELESESKE